MSDRCFSSSSLSSHVAAEFDRSNPLFERTRVPCEFIRCGGGDSGGASLGGIGAGLEGGMGRQQQQRNAVHYYTIRILSGRRSMPGPGGGGSERVVRFELSDECSSSSVFRGRPKRSAADDYRAVGDRRFGSSSSSSSSSSYGPECESSQRRQNEGCAADGTHLRSGGGARDGCRERGHRPPVSMQAQQHPPAMQGRRPSLQSRNEELPRGFFLSTEENEPIPSTPIHLYELEVGEMDFANLRRDQALLVDFADFASSFICLLGFCDLGEVETKEERDLRSCGAQNQGNSGRAVHGCDTPSRAGGHMNNFMCSPPPPQTPYSAGTPRYTCRLEDFSSNSSISGDDRASWGARGGVGGNQHRQQSSSSSLVQARFSVVESNQFRELTHLSLHLARGTDSSVRSYLSARLRQSMAEEYSLRCRLSTQVSRAEYAESMCQDAQSRCAEAEARAEEEKGQLRLEAAEELRSEMGRSESNCEAKLADKDKEIKRLREEAERGRKELCNRADDLAERVDSLTNEKAAAEAEIVALKESLRQRDETLLTLREETESLRARSERAIEEKDRMERSLHQIQLRVAALEQANESQERALAQADSMREAAASGEARANESAEEHKGQLEALKGRLSEAESELGRLREALERYRKDRQDTKKKMKSKIELIREQEEYLAEKESEAYDFQRKLGEAARELEKYKVDVQRKEAELKEAQTKLGESAKLLESNQQVITWLNKEINEAHMGRSAGRTAAPTYSSIGMGGFPSTSYSFRQSGNSGMQYSSVPASAIGGQTSSSLSCHDAFSVPSTAAQPSSFGDPLRSMGSELYSRPRSTSFAMPSVDLRVGSGEVLGAAARAGDLQIPGVGKTASDECIAGQPMPNRWPPTVEDPSAEISSSPPRKAPLPTVPTPKPTALDLGKIVKNGGGRSSSSSSSNFQGGIR